MMWARYRTYALVLFASGALFTGLMGFLHTPAGMRAWGSVTGSSCPFAVSHDPRQRDAARAVQANALRGEIAASNKLALGFEFDKTTRADIEAWAKKANAKCSMTRVSVELECKVPRLQDLPGSQLADASGTVFFDFDAGQRLKRVSAWANLKAPELAASTLQNIVQNVVAQVGGHADIAGEMTPAYLAANLLRQTSAEFHLKDFYAHASVTNMGSTYALQQTYQSLTF